MKILVFVLLALVTQSFAQTSESVNENDPSRLFTVQIRQFVAPVPWGQAQFACVGTLLSLRHVLTSASCLQNFNAANLLVVHGTVNSTWVNGSAPHELVETVERHPNFSAANDMLNNIAILTVSSMPLKSQFSLILSP